MSKQIIGSITVIGLAVSACLWFATPTTALSGSSFNAGNIIDDSVFYNKDAMTPVDIQAFLNAKVPHCDTWGTQASEYGGGTRAQYGTSRGYPPPYVCLKDYHENPNTKENNLQGRPIPSGARSAAQLIWDAAQAYNINPQVLLVLIQKESVGPLITDTWPFYSQYRTATGYGCPDTAPCDQQYYGFSNQVTKAAFQFRRYATYPNQYNYIAGQNNFILYNPNHACGGSTVFIENTATAGLYNYTPYRPNQAALNNLYGTGDSCSSYGNRNFWRLFNDWFGSTVGNTTTVPHPDGTLVNWHGRIYLIQDQKLRYITNPWVFDSYNFSWGKVVPASQGDFVLPEGEPLSQPRTGSLIKTDNSPVYVVMNDGGVTKKAQMTYDAFLNLNFSWDQVVYMPSWAIPGTDAPLYSSHQHPDGSLVFSEGRISLMENGTRRPIISSRAFESHNFRWKDVKGGTQQDLWTPYGAPLNLAEGTLVSDYYNIYVMDTDGAGDTSKRIISPWLCFSNRMGFKIQNVLFFNDYELPPAHGPVLRC